MIWEIMRTVFPHSFLSKGSLGMHSMESAVLSKIWPAILRSRKSCLGPSTLTSKMLCNTYKRNGYISFHNCSSSPRVLVGGDALEFRGILWSQSFSTDFQSWFTFSLSPVVCAVEQHSLPARSIRFM